MGKSGYLILENGLIFKGVSFGTEIDVSGEIVFNTGMVGYPESFTDPSYYGQILTLTYPLIGNYGVPPGILNNNLPQYLESKKIQIRGLIVSSYIENISHWQSRRDLSNWLKSEGIPALSGIDTKSLTKIIRETGVMKAVVTFQKPRTIRELPFYDINSENLIPYVSCKEVIHYGNGKIKILFIDCGFKSNQIKIFLKHNTTVIRIPWNYNPFEKKNFDFDAVFISNGPGDARNMKETVETVRECLNRKIPTFGICLGHQILALAANGNIYKLKYGHRGQNQPVKNLFDGKCYITSQNHGFSVIEKSLPKDWKVWFRSLNDGTNEGICHDTLPFFAVQFHPEAKPGPTDTEWLFKYFIDKIKK